MRCLEHVYLAALLACALLFISGGVKADGCHTPEADIGTEAGLARDLCAINDALGRSPPDYVTAGAFYRQGLDSRDITFEDIATGAVLQGSYVADSIALFGDKAWMDKIVTAALAGNGPYTTDTKRVQVIKKILQGSALGHLMLSNLDRAAAAARSNKGRAIEYVERAMANFFGLESDCAIFGNGQARGIEFGTMRDGVSAANYDLVESFADAVLAIRETPVDSSALTNAIETIEKSFITIYLQAVVKYANRIIDDNGAEKGHAEGFGYYHAIAGQVSKVDKPAHNTIFNAFNVASNPDAAKARNVLRVIRRLRRDFKISDALFGKYKEGRAYQAPQKRECEAVNPFVETNVDFIDSDR